MADSPYLVVGLGNPGPKYAANRHNVGFMVADLLAERISDRLGSAASWTRNARARAEVFEGRLSMGGPRVILVKPLTYMNLAGQSAGPLAVFFKVPNAQVIAVHDELDLPYGVLRLKSGGGEGGHNGLKSLTKALGGRDYLRLRFGIGRPPGRMDPAAFVLQDFSTAERTELPLFTELAADAVEQLITDGLTTAQNAHHKR
ncbi:peptidyl-tRNA hydrolase [Stackebrandtia endophytica]|uniref:Peptidyl-tRNA hydrolase n=1 Tax=Stackebrandtia endophytica TaxID=1496996 RepID=A0A543B082_9ACTN|nr:aminoacyl-tRNA hydrolase [Stackebrandtia endophytica]TQL78247.1 peptidyl-tRNA hydrolase [Stackebrandtia endophytica]